MAYRLLTIGSLHSSIFSRLFYLAKLRNPSYYLNNFQHIISIFLADDIHGIEKNHGGDK